MKKVATLVFSICCFAAAISQSNFQRVIGGVGDERGHAIIVTGDGGYALAGHTSSFGSGDHDIILMKLDGQGAIQWQKTFGGPDREDGAGITLIETPDNGLVVSGSTSSFSGEPRNLYVFKTDASGNLLWDYRYDSGNPTFPFGDHARGLINTSDGNILVIGTDDSHLFGANDGLVMKIDQDGNLLWKRLYSKDDLVQTNHLISALEIGNGDFLIFGESMAHGPGIRAGYLLRISGDGNLQWANTYGGSDEEAFRGGDFTDDNGIILTGFSTSFGAGQSDILLCKLDTSGSLQWTKTFGGALNDRGTVVRTLPDGSGYLILGHTESFGNGEIDIVVIKTNISGDILWSRTFGSDGVESIHLNAIDGLQLTDDAGFVVTGWTDGLSMSGEDILILKSDSIGSVFCGPADISSTSPAMETVVTETLTGETGSYESVDSEVADAAMISEQLCHCISDTACHLCEQTIVHYDLNNCISFIGGATSMDYSEFTPMYPSGLSYAQLSASTVYRENPAMNKHSCTPGVEGSTAMCVGSLNACTYAPGDQRSVVFELTIVPSPDSAVTVTGLTFFEKAPQMYEWIGGGSGLNNYPTRFGVRVLKNDMEIFRQVDIPTSIDVWREEVFDFLGDDDFLISDSSTLRFELLGYCLVGNAAQVDAWDLDEISVRVACEAFTGENVLVSGSVRTRGHQGIGNAIISMSDNPDFTNSIFVVTDENGKYVLEDFQMGDPLFVNAYKNTGYLDGVSTLDLIRIQKHLLGIQLMDSPYQLLAADANRSNSVSVLDIVEIRRLILGKIPAFQNNTSWRFGDAAQDLSSGSPWDFKETLTVPNAGMDIGNAHFIAVKVGDVTGDADGLDNQPSNTETTDVVVIQTREGKLLRGEEKTIRFTGSDLKDVNGLQCAIRISGAEILNVESGAINLTDENYSFDQEGLLKISWHAENAVSITEDVTLFSVRIRSHREGMVSQRLTIESESLRSEVYQRNASVILPLLIQTTPVGGKDTDGIFEISPNPANHSVLLRFHTRAEGEAVLRLHSTSGQLLYERTIGHVAGENTLSIPLVRLGIHSAVILCSLETDDFAATQRIVILQ